MRRRVVLVSSSFPYGPGEGFLVPELAAMSDAGLAVIVVPAWPRGPSRDWDAPANVRVVTANRREMRPNSDVLSGFLRGYQARTVGVGRSSGAGVLSSIRREVVASTVAPAVAAIASRHRAGHIHAYWATGPSTVARMVSHRLRMPWSATAHSGDIYGNLSFAKQSRSAAFVRAISTHGAEALVNLGVAPHKIDVIHIGVAVPTLVPKARPLGPLRGISAANLIPLKGHDVLLEAIAGLRREGLRLDFDFAGDGPLRERLIGLADHLGLRDQIGFLGHLPRAKLLTRLESGQYQLMVLASSGTGIAAEGIPVSLMEAMAAGIAVVATDSGGTRELFPTGSHRLVAPGDVNGLQAGIRSMIMSDNLRREAEIEGRRIVLSSFDSAVNGRMLAERIGSAM